jgi:drug/metabolite transporter (DMT)-like permease
LDKTLQPRISPILGLFVAVLAASTSSIFIRFAQTEAPSLAIAAWRLCFASMVLVPMAIARNRAEIGLLKPGSLALLALSGIFLCFHFASWITSLEYTTVPSSVVLVTTSPLWVAVLSPLVLRERLPGVVWIGLTIALLGGTIVGGGQACQIGQTGIDCSGFQNFLNGRPLFGNFLALVGAWCGAGYLLVGRWVRPTLSLLSYTAIVYGIAAVGLVILALVTHTQLFGFQPVTFIWFVLLALIPQLIGHSTYNWALRYLSAAYVSIALLGEPIGTSILALLLLKESPTILEIVGGILTLIGIFIASRVNSSR